MGNIAKFSIIFGGFCTVSLATQAAEQSELEQLRREMNELRKRYEAQSKALQTLEHRLQQVEGSKQARNLPSQTPKVGAPTPGERQLTEAPKQVQEKRSTGTTAAGSQMASGQTAPSTKETTAGAGAAKATDAATKGTGEKVVKQAPPSRVVETVLQEEHTLFDKRFTLEAGVTYSQTNRAQINLSGFLALDAIFLGQISVNEVDSQIVQMDLTGRYSVTDRFQIDLNTPFLYRNSNYIKGGVGGVASRQVEADVTLDPTVGDINAGVYYRLFKESEYWPDIVWNVRGKAPTGTRPYGIKVVQRTIDTGNGQTQQFSFPESLASGNGIWTASTGFSFVKSFDPAVFFANVSYFYNFEGSFKDISTNPNETAPGDIDLGNSYQYGLGTAFALNERTSISLSYSQRFFEDSRTRVKGQSWSTIVGSGGTAATLNVGVTFGLTNQVSTIFNVGIGLTPDAPDVQVGLKVPYTF